MLPRQLPSRATPPTAAGPAERARHGNARQRPTVPRSLMSTSLSRPRSSSRRRSTSASCVSERLTGPS